MGGGASFSFVTLKPDLTPISSFLNEFGSGDLANSYKYGFSFGGFAYVMVVKNLRIGGLGFGAGNSTQKITIDGLVKKAVYSYGGGGVTVEYTLPFIRSVAVSVGAIIGGATAKFEFYQNLGIIDWRELSDNFANGKPSKNTMHSITNNFFTFAPTINFELPVNRFLAVRLGGGYIIPFSDEWKADDEVGILNLPSDLKSNTFFVQAGVLFGFFIFN